jgi:YVTN family beta-propeller protein
MRRLLLCGLILGVVAVQTGCKSTSVVAVTISPAAVTVSLGQTQQFTAAVTGNSNTNVTWTVNSVTGGNSTVGTISTQGLYTAPSNALNASSVGVVATSVADTSMTATATVTINSGAVVTLYCASVTCGTAGVTLGAGQTYQFTDVVTNTISTLNQSTAVNWLVNGVQGGSSSSGSITTTGFYTAPTQIGSTTTFVIEAQLQANINSFGTTTVTVVPAGAPTLSAINPATVAQGSLFEDVYLEGSNFLSTSVARANGIPVATSFISTSVLRARIPAASLASFATLPNTIFIDVQQQSGALSAAADLNVVAAPAALISTSPNSTPQNGGALSVTFDGGYYSSATTTEFNGQVRPATPQADIRQLNVALNASDVTTAGLFPVSVRNNALPSQLAAANLAVASNQAPTILTTLGVGPAPNAVAVNTVTGIAVVANSGTGANANTISLIDLNPADANYLHTVGTPLQVGVSPTSVAIDNIRNLAVVTNNGSNSVSIIDLSTSPPTVKATITAKLDVKPYSVGVNPLTGQALVVYQGSSTATIIDLNKLVVSSTGQIPTTGVTPEVAVDQRLNWGIVPPGGGGSGNLGGFNGPVSIVDLGRSGQTVVFSIAVPNANGAVRSSGTVTITTTGGSYSLTVGQQVVVAGVDDSSFDGTFTIATVTGTTFTYTQAGPNTTSGNGTVSVGAPLVTINLDPNIQGVGINNETDQAVFADPASTSVILMSLLDQTIKNLTLEIGTAASAVNSLTNTAVVVNQVGNTASILDLQVPQRTAQFAVGTKPVAVAIDPVTDVAVVVNQGSNTVTLIQLGSIRPLQVVQMSPFNLMTSTTNQTVTLIGNGFTGSSVVRFNESALATTFVSPRELTATIPSTLLGAPERYVVDVLNLDGTQSNANDFTVMQAIPVGTAPRGVAIDRQRHLAVVTNSGSNTVSVINLSSLSISGTLNVGNSPQGVALSSVAGRAVVANTNDDTVSIIDLNNIAVSSRVSVAPAAGGTATSKPIGIAVHPGTGQVVVADSNATQLSFFNISNPATPTTLGVDVGPNAVAIDYTQNIAAVSEGGSGEVVIVDLGTQQILSRVTGFQLPTGVIYDPDSATFLVTSSLANNFGSISANPATQTYTVTFNRIGINPTSIDYNYRSSTLVTTNTFSQTMSVMDFLTKTVKAVIPLSVSQQFAVAIDPVTNRAVVVDQNDNQVLIVPLPK